MSSMQELPPPGAPATSPLPVPPARPHLRVVPDVALDFDGAVRTLTPRLQRYATRRLGDAHEAEELVQEALLRAYKNRDALLTEDDVAAWTTVVVGRLVIDRLRVRGRSVNVAVVPETTRVERDTADVVVARDEARTALDALDAMPARQAAVLWAREVEGQGYDQIGQRFGMTEPAVRSILTRARKALRREYAARGGTLPVAGLAVLAPWVVGLRWAERLRSAAGRVAVPAALGALGVGLLGGALSTPLLDRHERQPSVGQAVVSSSAAEPGGLRPGTIRAGAATADSPAAAGVVGDSRPARAATLVEDGPIKVSCTSAAGAGAGNEACAPGTDPASTIYVGPTLPENPTGVRDVGVETDRVSCADMPRTPLTTCTADAHHGGTQ